MLASIGTTLPRAVGIAASPFPIIAVIIILMAQTTKSTSALFLCGWVLGVLAATTVFSFVTRLAVGEDSDAESQPVLACIKIALGVLLLLLAGRQWRKRPRPYTLSDL